MDNKLFIFSEESSAPPYFLIIKLDNKMVFDAIGHGAGFVFREILKEKIIELCIHSHNNFQLQHDNASTIKFSDTSHLWFCMSNKDFFDKLKAQLASLNEVNFFTGIDSTADDREKVATEINTLISYAFLEVDLPCKENDVKIKKVKI